MGFFNKLGKEGSRMVHLDEQKQNIGIIKDVLTETKQAFDDRHKTEEGSVPIELVTAEQKKRYLSQITKYSTFFVVLAIAVVVYSIYLVMHSDYLTALMGVVFFGMCLVLLLKYRMMRFQLVNAPNRVSLGDYFHQLFS